jgi:hypothetical protein
MDTTTLPAGSPRRELTETPRIAEVASPPTPPAGDVELNHLISRSDMAKTDGVIGFCGTPLEPWSGGFSRGAPGANECVVCFEMWLAGRR